MLKEENSYLTLLSLHLQLGSARNSPGNHGCLCASTVRTASWTLLVLTQMIATQTTLGHG